ncbi:MAG TPA: hypothetical protein DDZ42_13090 [Candidatus Rokubacteria bacterium]|nr:hypothetical protein [Candidatus Rokubacteria bacterium]
MAYRILSLSGGGMRGVFQAAYLQKVAGDLTPIGSHFDLIAGTSTGALIALALALDVDLGEVVRLFQERGPEIFPPRRFARLVDPVRYGPRYRQHPLRTALERVFGDRRLRECKPPVVIAATNLDRFGHRVFTTLKEADGTASEDEKLLALDVALASSAAPTYLPAAKPVDEERTYVDGGLWANNPALAAAVLAHSRAHVRFHEIRLAIVGNGEVPQGALRANYDSASFIGLVRTTAELMFAAQTTAAEYLVELLMGAENVFRVNPPLHSPIPLDDPIAARNVLLPLAETFASTHRASLVEFLQRPPSSRDLELLELRHTHRYQNPEGDFEAEITYKVRNASELPVSELLPDSTSFFGWLPKPPGGPVHIAGRFVEGPAGPASVELEQLSAAELMTRKLDGQERNVTRFYWHPRVTPSLAPGATLTYTIVVTSQGTEKHAFGPGGSFAGCRTPYPTNRLFFRCEAPEGYRFDTNLEHFPRTEEGAAVVVHELPTPIFDSRRRALTWSITGGAVKTRVNYLVKFRLRP